MVKMPGLGVLGTLKVTTAPGLTRGGEWVAAKPRKAPFHAQASICEAHAFHSQKALPYPSGGAWRFSRPVWPIMNTKVTAGLPNVLKFTQKFSVCVRQITSFSTAMKTKK